MDWFGNWAGLVWRGNGLFLNLGSFWPFEVWTGQSGPGRSLLLALAGLLGLQRSYPDVSPSEPSYLPTLGSKRRLFPGLRYWPHSLPLIRILPWSIFGSSVSSKLVRTQGGGTQLTKIPNLQEVTISIFCLDCLHLEHAFSFLVTLWLVVQYKYAEVGEGGGGAPTKMTPLYNPAT